jgi:hypothetical protein
MSMQGKVRTITIAFAVLTMFLFVLGIVSEVIFDEEFAKVIVVPILVTGFLFSATTVTAHMLDLESRH